MGPRGGHLAFSPDGKHLAGESFQAIRLWETATGRELPPLVGHRGAVSRVIFSPDGTKLASAGADTTVLIWDADRLLGKGPPQRITLPERELEARWNDLAAKEPLIVEYAQACLISVGPQAVALVRERVREPHADPKHLAIVADLGSEDFEKRKKAFQELETLGTEADPALRQTLTRNPDAEVRRRLEQLLEKLDQTELARERLRDERLLEVLGHINTQEARQVLETFAKGPADSALTQQAKKALQRLARTRR
jgi:hypothetical protein